MNAPLYLARSGRVDNGSTDSMNNGGFYWSSSAIGSGSAHILLFYHGAINPESSGYRHFGFSLRCVLRWFTYSVVGTGPNNDNTIPNGIDLTGSQNVGYAPNAFTTIMTTHPLYFIRSGGLNGTTLYYFGGAGHCWSSTVYSPTGAYYLYFYSGELYPARRNNRFGGWSLRCLSR